MLVVLFLFAFQRFQTTPAQASEKKYPQNPSTITDLLLGGVGVACRMLVLASLADQIVTLEAVMAKPATAVQITCIYRTN